MAVPRQETADGFEMQLGVNHLAHFALTGLLLDRLTSTPRARVHNVSSSANYNGSINFDDLMGAREYGRWSAYGQSKLANVFFTYELNKRLAAAGHDTISNTSHPGLVMGNLQVQQPRTVRLQPDGTGPVWHRRTAHRPGHQHGRAAPAVRLHGGRGQRRRLLRPENVQPARLPGGKTGQQCAADDAAARRRFWEMSEELTGVKYAF
jgi:NAD(P)-dependent dehydrogenase (short-subunit alcohol dehydrogenase family)